jgi:tripartite-type tricarboxylate transporter receptor subunit TctC
MTAALMPSAGNHLKQDRSQEPMGWSAVKPPRRRFLHLAAGAAAFPAVWRCAWAQSYPSRPVRIISGFPPGGVNDTYARLIGQWLSERLGQQFIVENRSGAGGTIAAETLVRAIPDGYTLLLTTSADAWNATLYDNLKFDFIRDAAAVAAISRGPGVLVVHPSLPAKSVPELIGYAKSNPGKITVASAGVGSAPHMYWELFRSLSGVDMLHVPYRGGGRLSPICSAAKCKCISALPRHRSDMSGRGSCGRWR